MRTPAVAATDNWNPTLEESKGSTASRTITASDKSCQASNTKPISLPPRVRPAINEALITEGSNLVAAA